MTSSEVDILLAVKWLNLLNADIGSRLRPTHRNYKKRKNVNLNNTDKRYKNANFSTGSADKDVDLLKADEKSKCVDLLKADEKSKCVDSANTDKKRKRVDSMSTDDKSADVDVGSADEIKNADVAITAANEKNKDIDLSGANENSNHAGLSKDEKLINQTEIVNAVKKCKQTENKRKRRYWVHPDRQVNLLSETSAYTVFKELNIDPENFYSYYRMNRNSFDLLVALVGPKITRKYTNFRIPISPEERLLITLRYFATGCSFKTLSGYFLRGHTTIRNVVKTTAMAMWDALQDDFLPLPSREKWLEVARRYEKLWNLPNCVGGVGRKHIRIKAPPNPNTSCNIKEILFLVLLASADIDGTFLTIDIGEYGQNGDGSILQESSFGRDLTQGCLNLPDPCSITDKENDTPFPFYFVGDGVFPLLVNLMRPFPQKELSDARRIYNYRISRGRKAVESAFGTLISKFGVLQAPICCAVETTEIIVKAICILHNFIVKQEGACSQPTEFPEVEEIVPQHRTYPNGMHRGRPSCMAIDLRNRLCDYFLTPEGAVESQDNCVV